jgi:transcription elongation factor GreA
MVLSSVPMTRDGLAKVRCELDQLRGVRRQEVAARIHQARDDARPQNNAEFDDAKNDQARVEGRIQELERLLARATPIDEERTTDGCVRVGSRVTIRQQTGREQSYTIVGSAEANPLQGRISNESPCGRALLGRHVGDRVEVQAPSGAIEVLVTAIE